MDQKVTHSKSYGWGLGTTDSNSKKHPERISQNTQKFEQWSTTHVADRIQTNCHLTTNDNCNNQRRSNSCSTFSFQFTDDEIKSHYASTWKLRTSKYLLSQTLEKSTTPTEQILDKMAQGVHLGATRTKIVQRKQRNFQKRDVVLLKANSSWNHWPVAHIIKTCLINTELYKLW